MAEANDELMVIFTSAAIACGVKFTKEQKELMHDTIFLAGKSESAAKKAQKTDVFYAFSGLSDKT